MNLFAPQIKTASLIAVALMGVAAMAAVALVHSAPSEQMAAAKGDLSSTVNRLLPLVSVFQICCILQA